MTKLYWPGSVPLKELTARTPAELSRLLTIGWKAIGIIEGQRGASSAPLTIEGVKQKQLA